MMVMTNGWKLLGDGYGRMVIIHGDVDDVSIAIDGEFMGSEWSHCEVDAYPMVNSWCILYHWVMNWLHCNKLHFTLHKDNKHL